MNGHYTGVASDITVSSGAWLWGRLAGGGLGDMRLREPAEIHAILAGRTQNDPPLQADEIREDTR